MEEIMCGSESERTAKDSQDEFESTEVEATKFGENRASGITVSTNADDSLVYGLAHKKFDSVSQWLSPTLWFGWNLVHYLSGKNRDPYHVCPQVQRLHSNNKLFEP